MNGITLPAYGEADTKALQNGHPLFLNELWELEMYLAIYKDMSATHVFDICPGSGAAAMAAAIMGIQYDGIAMSQDHCDWLDQILNKAMFAIVVHSKDAEALEIKNELNQYFTAHIDEARSLLASGDEEEWVDEDGEEDDVEKSEDAKS